MGSESGNDEMGRGEGTVSDRREIARNGEARPLPEGESRERGRVGRVLGRLDHPFFSAGFRGNDGWR